MVQPKFKVLETGPPVSPIPGLAFPSVPVLFELPADAAQLLGYTHILAFPPGVLAQLPESFGGWIGHNRGAEMSEPTTTGGGSTRPARESEHRERAAEIGGAAPEATLAATNGPIDHVHAGTELMFERWWQRRFGRFADSQPADVKALCLEAYTAPDEFIAAPQTYDQVTADYMAQWSAIVPLEERGRLLDVVNQFAQLPDASRRVAAAVVCAIELISRWELIP